jgi:hypothetical protein
MAEAEARRQISYSEERIAYFERMLRERPTLFGIWTYWLHWYKERRRSWLTRLWLTQLRAWKREVRDLLPHLPTEDQTRRAEVIRKNINTVEDGLAVLLMEEKETERIARERAWHIRFPTPHRTMTGWIAAKRRRISRIRYWIKEIIAELPALWKQFVYVIYYAYTLPGAERHLEAHMEGQCHITETVQEKVKALANKLLRAWVAKVGYAIPLLTSGMEKPPYKGTKTAGESRWEWGIQYYRRLQEGRLIETPMKMKIKETQTLRFEVYDFDYAVVRREDVFDIPAVFWELSQEELEKRLKIGKYTPTEEI